MIFAYTVTCRKKKRSRFKASFILLAIQTINRANKTPVCAPFTPVQPNIKRT